MNFLVRAMGGAARSTLISSCATHVRDSANVPRVPKQQWLETNTLYFDDAEGPDRIGNYNVSSFYTSILGFYLICIGTSMENRLRRFISKCKDVW